MQDGTQFGNFFTRGPGFKDLLVASPRGILVSKNFGSNFGAPILWSTYVPANADLRTLQVADLNGDGLDDLVIRDLALGQLLVFTARSARFRRQLLRPGTTLDDVRRNDQPDRLERSGQ